MSQHKQLKRIALGGLLCLNFLNFSTYTYANDINIGRYLSVSEIPKADQQQLLQQTIQVHFPQNVKSIEQAMKFILNFSGYQLASSQSMSVEVKAMLKQHLPEVDRNFGPMSLKQGLTTLSGDTFYLLVDPVHRFISFKLKPQYQSMYESQTK